MELTYTSHSTKFLRLRSKLLYNSII